MTQRFLTNHTPAAWKDSPMDPSALHPVVNRRPANAEDLDSAADGKEFRVFLAVLAEEDTHEGTASPLTPGRLLHCT